MTLTSQSRNDQVALFELLFAMNWEDPEADRAALAVQSGETVMTVTSGCCNTFTLLLDDPGKVFAVDINPTQSYLLELKTAAIRRLEYYDLHRFLGLASAPDRLQIFEQLADDLSAPALSYWRGRPDAIRKGVIYSGKYESLVRLVTRFIQLLQGRERVEGLFRCRTVAEQRSYFETRWNNRRWRMIFKILANKRVISKRMGLNYFQFDDGSTSFAESFQLRFKRGICETPIESNYFLAQYFCGHYRGEAAIPPYLLERNLPVVRARLDRVVNIIAPAQEWFTGQRAASIHGFVLSNIGELMSQEETDRLFTALLPVAAQGARLCFPARFPRRLRSRSC
jgi:S-adenosylmethionine-diacylglycerol 3-amino-3-carboxypropyl transferase